MRACAEMYGLFWLKTKILIQLVYYNMRVGKKTNRDVDFKDMSHSEKNRLSTQYKRLFDNGKLASVPEESRLHLDTFIYDAF